MTGWSGFPARLLLSLLILSLPASAWAAQAPGVDTGALIRLIGGLLVVIAVIVALSWSLRRFNGFAGPAAGQLRSLAAISVGSRERVVLVQVGKQQLLLGVAPGRVQTLHVLDEPINAEPRATGEPVPFAERLRRAMQPETKR